MFLLFLLACDSKTVVESPVLAFSKVVSSFNLFSFITSSFFVEVIASKGKPSLLATALTRGRDVIIVILFLLTFLLLMKLIRSAPKEVVLAPLIILSNIV